MGGGPGIHAGEDVHGSLWLFWAHTPDARDWFTDNTDAMP